ncbi:hypothetical protein GON26_00400 [Flavobacterium sp. GA093]|uniref:Uncharacterized protein n=1 Tax=Flavobacterium hydrocarbonoxydans TaxID=2683249 RepID=A0A6I4NJQ6_9FLAO|nr:hypothetical protein [Flavobacterium hydrocarbonoxydans]MWB92815.1 hypothetical protein [Flavobacterium hydrocarbonoxydans]
MRNIITDTNIWYSITNEEIADLFEKGYRLVISSIILNEIYTSRNLYLNLKSFEAVKVAMSNILKNQNYIKFIDLNPLEFILSNIDPQIEPSTNSKFFLDRFKEILNANFGTLTDKDIHRGDISGLTTFINETSVKYKEEIKTNSINFKSCETIKSTESLIKIYVNDNLQQLNKGLPILVDLDYDKNGFFIIAFDELLRELSRSEQKLVDNDWVDIFNMAYVGKNDLYWTKEKSKQRLANNSKTEHFLYENSYS